MSPLRKTIQILPGPTFSGDNPAIVSKPHLEKQPTRWFWCVWNSSGKSPTVRHSKQEKAVNEAERLAKKYPGFNFYVLEAIDVKFVKPSAAA